ncbi:MAG: hypothetical protein JXA99_05200 [Candidatus Lokiarchaeota archaeon]|nr:hypothetical protein [Candidatus Lokiarchaeota archaeon]
MNACPDNSRGNDIKSSHNKPEFGVSWWVQSGSQQYLRVIATNHYQLGLQMGQQLAVQIFTMDAVLKGFAQMNGIDIAQITYLMTIYDLSIPQEYKSFIQGISDATGLTYYDIMFQVTWIDVYYGFLIPMQIQALMPQIAACTAMGSKTTLGQTFDLGAIMGTTLAFVKYTLLDRKPITVFSLWQGACTYPMGKNSKDVMAVVNLVQTIIPGELSTPLSIKSMIGFETAKNAAEFENILLSSFTGSYNFIISDRRSNGAAIQSLPPNPYLVEHVDIEDIETVEVRTNTFVRPDFSLFLIDPTYSYNRQLKAEELAMVEYNDNGRLSTNEILNILQYNDGTDATINRPPNPYNPLDPATLAYIAMDKHYVKFGLGLVSDDYGLLWM